MFAYHTALWHRNHFSEDMFPAAPNGPLTIRWGLGKLRTETCYVPIYGCLNFFSREVRGQDVWQEGSGKRRSSSDMFCELAGHGFFPPSLRTEVEGLTPPCYQGLSNAKYAILRPQSTFAPHAHEHRRTARRFLHKRKSCSRCICDAGNRAIERREGLATARSKHPFQC